MELAVRRALIVMETKGWFSSILLVRFIPALCETNAL